MRKLTDTETYHIIWNHYAKSKHSEELMKKCKDVWGYAKYLHDTNEYSGCYPAYTTKDCYEVDLTATKKGVTLGLGLSLVDEDRSITTLSWETVAAMCFAYKEAHPCYVRELTPKAWSKVWTAVWNL